MSDLDASYKDSPDAYPDNQNAYKSSPDAYNRISSIRKMFDTPARQTTFHGAVDAASGQAGQQAVHIPTTFPSTGVADSGYAWIAQAESSDDEGSDVCFGAPEPLPGNVENAPQAIENFALCVSGQQSTLDLQVDEGGANAFLAFGSGGSSNNGKNYTTGPCMILEADDDAVSIILTPESGNGATVTIDALASVFSSNSVTAVDFFVYDPERGGRAIVLGAPL